MEEASETVNKQQRPDMPTEPHHHDSPASHEVVDGSSTSSQSMVDGPADGISVQQANEPTSPATDGGRPPHELINRLNLDDECVPASKSSSGTVISVNFCMPYKAKRTDGGEWILSRRSGTSALFDSFSHLSSSDSRWMHKLVAWTGEIEQLPGDNHAMQNYASLAAQYKNTPAVPMPVNPQDDPEDTFEPFNLTLSAGDRRNFVQRVRSRQGGVIHPVWLPEEMNEDGSYVLNRQEKCRAYGDDELFNLFHYKQHEASDGRATKIKWDDYQHMNNAFAQAVMEVYRPGDAVMIHDFHLLLLPEILRRLVPNMSIGFFLHIPFPDYEYFRTLTKREALLQGMLAADMIGFQTSDYAMHFAHSCDKLLGLEASEYGVEYQDSYTAFESFSIGVNANHILKAAFHENVSAIVAQFSQEKIRHGRQLIVGRDRLDSARGVAQKLQAFEIFLERHPDMVGKVILLQVTSPLIQDDREKKKDKLDNIVARINGNSGNLGYTPVHYYPQHFEKEEYLALLRVADLALITSVRDGMNTTALEYILCQREKMSPLLISEFSGTAASLDHALASSSFSHNPFKINPWDLVGVADTIYEALSMSEDDKIELHQELFEYVTTHDVQQWTAKCIDRLTANVALNGRSENTPQLDCTELLRRYTMSNRRLFMFDYDGTLTPIVSNPAEALPTETTIRTIKTLASDTRNAVWIISGRDQSFLDAIMGPITALGLSAEHGSFIRMPHSTEWEDLTLQFDMGWQPAVMTVLDKYTLTAVGSYIERKKIAVTWHYRKVEDEEDAKVQAQKCRKELNDTVVKEFEVDVMAGKANIEVRPRFVNKGEIVRRIVKAYGEGRDEAPDFVLCAGDDFTDEDMFQALRSSALPPEQVFAVTVGENTKATLASSCVSHPEDVISVIAMLNACDEGEGGMGN